ncbi:MAG: HEAT repeat domain-containing protein [Polyangiaceae bacterium]
MQWGRVGLSFFGFLVSLVLTTSPVFAKDSVSTLAKRLRDAEDFRVRTQAALALGASKSKQAVKPLCEGLEDSNTTVRAASAAGLGRLKLGGQDCLETRLKGERSSAVKSSIKRALAHLAEGEAPALTSKTEYYVSIGKVTNKTEREDSALNGLTRKAMAKAMKGLEGYAVAPAAESSTDAKKLLSKFPKVKAFYLSPKVQKPSYSGGNLTVRVEVAIFTYPGKALKGTVPVKLTQEGVSSDDEAAETELIKMALERAIEKFSKNVGRID